MAIWRDKVVLITGGSEGLGLEIARAFALRGATVCIVSRDQIKLQTARQTLADESLQVHVYPCDVTNDQQVTDTFEQIIRQHDRLDVLVNNVGKSTRCNISEASVAEFQDLMEANFYTVVRCTKTALPELVKTKGHVVNIGSLASKTAWPFIAPYTTSKHAVAAYTHQLRIDGPRDVHFMLVCPGPIRRGDAGVRYSQQAAHLPKTAQQPAAGAKLKGISSAKVAKRIVAGCERRKAEIVMPFYAKYFFAVSQISPRLGDWMIRKMRRE